MKKTKKKENLKLKKGDFVFIAIIICVAVVLFLIQLHAGQGNQVLVTVAEQSTIYSLSQNRRIPLQGKADLEDENVSDTFTNVLVIEDGTVYMESANCPDQVCVKHKPIYKDGEMIICLPHQVYVEVDSDIGNDIDN